MSKDKYLERIEVDGEIYYVRNHPSFFSNPLDWMMRKIKFIFSIDPFKNEGLSTCIFGVIILGIVSICCFIFICQFLKDVDIDRSPKKINGPFELTYYTPAKMGYWLIIEKDGWWIKTTCLGVSEEYCHKTVRKKYFSDEYFIEYVVGYSDVIRSRAAVSMIGVVNNNQHKILFKNELLWFFLIEGYVTFFVFFLPIAILMFKNFYDAFRRLVYLLRN